MTYDESADAWTLYFPSQYGAPPVLMRDGAAEGNTASALTQGEAVAPSPPSPAPCSQEAAVKMLQKRARGISQLNNGGIDQISTWEIIGQCTWSGTGLAGDDDPLTQQHETMNFRAAVTGTRRVA